MRYLPNTPAQQKAMDVAKRLLDLGFYPPLRGFGRS